MVKSNRQNKPESPSSWLPVLDYEQGNANAQLALRRFRERTMTQAYLITGSKGSGKLTLAKALTCALFCTEEAKPCFHCEACRQVLTGNHPAVHSLFLGKEKSIKIEPTRALIREISGHAMSGGTQVVLIEPVDQMRVEAQNALLKSLEEPSVDVVFILMAHEPSSALGTIASRCSRIKLLPRSDETLLSTLLQCGFEEAKIRPVLKLCSGNIGLAVKLLLPQPKEQELPELGKLLCPSSDAEGLALTVRMKENKDQAQAILSEMEEAVHRCLLVASGCGGEELIPDLPPLWKKAAMAQDYAAMARVLEAIRLTNRRLSFSVNWQSNFDMLTMSVMQEVQAWQSR